MIPQLWSYVQIKSKSLWDQIGRAFDLQLRISHISIPDCSPDQAPPVAEAENRHFPGKSGRLPSQQDLRYVYQARNFDGKWTFSHQKPFWIVIIWSYLQYFDLWKSGIFRTFFWSKICILWGNRDVCINKCQNLGRCFGATRASI